MGAAAAASRGLGHRGWSLGKNTAESKSPTDAFEKEGRVCAGRGVRGPERWAQVAARFCTHFVTYGDPSRFTLSVGCEGGLPGDRWRS